MTHRVIMVDDEEQVLQAAEQWLSLADMEVSACGRADEALAALSPDFPGALVADVMMPGMDGITLLRRVVERDRDLPVVLITGHGDIAMAVEAMRIGAYDFLEKPYEPERFVDTVRRACEKRRLILENRKLREELASHGDQTSSFLGRNTLTANVRRDIALLASADVSVLVRGETGTGKELVARCLHDRGPRARANFVAINCGAIPESIFESELFGHEEGAFTNAARRRIGRFEHADGGTIFLDEIESMPVNLQVKLLRVLDERTFERLGSNKPITVDVRVVAATKADLLEASKQGGFRSDLYYRLNVAEICLPPLRERTDDIPLLFDHFVSQAAETHGRDVPERSPVTHEALLTHDWPGNVRELKNVAERYVLGIGAAVDGLPALGGQPAPAAVTGEIKGRDLAEQMRSVERHLIEQALIRNRGSLKAVCEELKLPRRTLHHKMSVYGLTRSDYT